jgi:hypothetical protein
MEKANNLSCVRIKPRNVRPLEAIAVDTGQGKILKFGFASMLPSDDVIYLEWERGKTPTATDNIRNNSVRAPKPSE